MSLVTLPEEVLEILFLYVDKEDLLSVCNVVGLEGSDYFWRKICKREGFKISIEDECWKTVFCCNINWTTGQFVKRWYNFDKVVPDTRDINFISMMEVIHGKNFILRSRQVEEISIWNIDKYPVLITQLPASFIKMSKSKLLVHSPFYNLPKAKVYLSYNNTYSEVLNLNDNNMSLNLPSDYTLTDDYFAAVTSDFSSIKVVHLENNEEYMLSVSDKEGKAKYIVIFEFLLNVMVLEGSKYFLRRYNLEKREWLDELLLFQDVRPENLSFLNDTCLLSFSEPRLEISSDILVIWKLEILGGIDSTTALIIWKSNGELIRSLSFEFIRSFRIQRVMRQEHILWLIVEGEYVIFSNHKSSIMIWNLKDPDVCKELEKSKDFYHGQTVISNRLLILSYTHCFKVVDFRKAVYLYTVWFENDQLNNGFDLFLRHKFIANEYFYCYIREYKDEIVTKPTGNRNISAEGCSKNEVSFNLSDFSMDESDIETTKSRKTYKLTIYDFRVGTF